MPKRTVNFTAVDANDLLGNNGPVADANWSEVWAPWDHAERKTYFAGAAQWGVLNRSAARALIQGLPPPPAGWGKDVDVLGEYAAHVARLDLDVHRGAIPMPITPVELTNWCDKHAVRLPEPFVEAVQAVERNDGPAIGGQQSPVGEPYPSWIPLPQSVQKEAPKRSRGRPQTRKEDYKVLCRKGSDVLMQAARDGTSLTLRQVAEEIRKTEAGVLLELDTIIARLKGHLPVAKAKKTAAASAARTHGHVV